MKKNKNTLMRIIAYPSSILIIIASIIYFWGLLTQQAYAQVMFISPSQKIGFTVSFLAAWLYLITDILIIMKNKKERRNKNN